MKKQLTLLVIIFFSCLSSKAQFDDAEILKKYPYKGIPVLMIEVFNDNKKEDEDLYYLNKFPWKRKKLFPLLAKIIKEIKDQPLNIFFDPNDDKRKLILLKNYLDKIGFSKVKYFKVSNLKSKFIEYENVRKKKDASIKSVPNG